MGGVWGVWGVCVGVCVGVCGGCVWGCAGGVVGEFTDQNSTLANQCITYSTSIHCEF